MAAEGSSVILEVLFVTLCIDGVVTFGLIKWFRIEEVKTVMFCDS
jgi:hypothetical protein